MIKKVNKLTAREMTEFRKTFIKYFNESCTAINGKTPKFLESFMTSVRNRKYAASIIEMIKEGKKEGFVSLDDSEEAISGFLIGDIENGVGVISHFFIDVKCPIGRRIQSLELFKVFNRSLVTRDVFTVMANCSIKDDDLNDTLSSLGFSITRTDDKENEYAMNIL